MHFLTDKGKPNVSNILNRHFSAVLYLYKHKPFVMAYISQLYIYPVKSLGGIALQQAQVTTRGLHYDRRWMLIDDNKQFLSQRKHPEMALFHLQILDEGLLVRHQPSGEELLIPYQPQTYEDVVVQVWDDTCTGTYVGNAFDQWFSHKLGISCRLLHMADDSIRPVDTRYAGAGHITSFSDGYPMLLISEASLQDLNSRLDNNITMRRFRPNIVIADTEPYFEDTLKHFEVADIEFYGVKPCARCVMIGVDPDTATSGPEPLRTLAGYRKAGHKIFFGQNLIHSGTGMIQVGDSVNVKELGPGPELAISAGTASLSQKYSI